MVPLLYLSTVLDTVRPEYADEFPALLPIPMATRHRKLRNAWKKPGARPVYYGERCCESLLGERGDKD